MTSWAVTTVGCFLIKGKVEKNKSKNPFADFEILSQAKKLSVIQQEKLDLLKLVKKIKVNKLKIESDAVKKEIKKHLQKYY